MLRHFVDETKPKNRTENVWAIVVPSTGHRTETISDDGKYAISSSLGEFDSSWDLNARSYNPRQPRYGRDLFRGDLIAKCSVATVYGDTYRDQTNTISGSDDYDKVRYWESIQTWQIVELYKVGNLGKLRRI